MSRHGQPGYYSLADLPQRGIVSQVAISSGWPEMDELWKIYPGQFTMVTGTPGHGKSTFLLNAICNMARQHHMKTMLYGPENEGHIHEKMRLIWGASAGFTQFAKNYCFVQSSLPEEYDGIAKTLPWVLDRAIVAIQNDGIELLVVDPWNELERAKPPDMLLTDYIGQCLQYMKNFARIHKIAVILVAHPTKSGLDQGRTPTLADIENSIQWYNKCDNGLIVSRDHTTGITKVISAKVREIGAGALGEAHFMVDKNTGEFKMGSVVTYG